MCDRFKVILLQPSKLGAFSDGDTPVPIPNTEVKPISADGS